jgi:hypothetical protein
MSMTNCRNVRGSFERGGLADVGKRRLPVLTTMRLHDPVGDTLGAHADLIGSRRLQRDAPRSSVSRRKVRAVSTRPTINGWVDAAKRFAVHPLEDAREYIDAPDHPAPSSWRAEEFASSCCCLLTDGPVEAFRGGYGTEVRWSAWYESVIRAQRVSEVAGPSSTPWSAPAFSSIVLRRGKWGEITTCCGRHLRIFRLRGQIRLPLIGHAAIGRIPVHVDPLLCEGRAWRVARTRRQQVSFSTIRSTARCRTSRSPRRAERHRSTTSSCRGYGVFVVEAKNMNGWIFGKRARRPVDHRAYFGNKTRFQNPLRQNYRHIAALR